jgi:glycosyltransferase involved in cell wall biosynthesis
MERNHPSTPGTDRVALVVRDIRPTAVGGAALRNRGLAAAIRNICSESVVIETDVLRADVGCATQCQDCAGALVNLHGDRYIDPFPWNYCRRACAALPEILAGHRVRAALVSELMLHRWFSALVDTGLPAVAMDLHNSESDVFRDNKRHPAARRLDPLRMVDTQVVTQLEHHISATATMITFVSELDRSRFRRRCQPAATAVVPNSVDTDATTWAPIDELPPVTPDLLLLGLLSYFPNIEAAVRLVDAILPAIRSRLPEATVTIAGSDPHPSVTSLADPPVVTVLADPADIRPLLRGRILAAPLTAGGGTRLKLLEAFAAGTPVISTAKGAEGLDVVSGRHYLRAEARSADWAAAVDNLLSDPAADRTRRLAARHLVEARYSWRAIQKPLRHALALLTR